jgi:selenocysteine lyase/cysteine desulfurase
VSTLLAPVAASLRPGTRVLVAEGDFTSLLWPFAVQQARGVRLRVVEHGDLIDAIDATTDVVAVSAVQSATGTPVDLDRLAGAADAHGARVVLDATQAAGWAELDAGRFSHVVVSAYKWLLCPRGVAFLTVRDADVDPDLLAHGAGWYAGEDPWATCYGTELRLAADARRFDASPAWALWGAAAESLEAIAAVGVAPIAAHDLALAARLRDAAGLPPMTSPIVRVERPNVAARLAQAGIAAAVRGGASRLAVHLYTTGDDIDRALAALAAG